jgi:hypothetical protein
MMNLKSNPISIFVTKDFLVVWLVVLTLLDLAFVTSCVVDGSDDTADHIRAYIDFV